MTMKFEHGMGTLMTVFSGVAALMCLLVGIQLLFLESRIGQAAANSAPAADVPLLLWKAEAHTGAIMSLGAGVLILLFGLRHHAIAGRAAKPRTSAGETAVSSADLESLSVRVFEVDATDRSVEISASPDEPRPPAAPPARPTMSWAPLDEGESKSKPGTDPADSILRSIREATSPDSGPETGPEAGSTTRHPHKPLWKKFFGRRKNG
ncbi:MAG: hypothetical protein ABFS42_02940 [Candidatus Krumholzibacteriota bacterium]